MTSKSTSFSKKNDDTHVNSKVMVRENIYIYIYINMVSVM